MPVQSGFTPENRRVLRCCPSWEPVHSRHRREPVPSPAAGKGLCRQLQDRGTCRVPDCCALSGTRERAGGEIPTRVPGLFYIKIKI